MNITYAIGGDKLRKDFLFFIGLLLLSVTIIVSTEKAANSAETETINGVPKYLLEKVINKEDLTPEEWKLALYGALSETQRLKDILKDIKKPDIDFKGFLKIKDPEMISIFLYDFEKAANYAERVHDHKLAANIYYAMLITDMNLRESPSQDIKSDLLRRIWEIEQKSKEVGAPVLIEKHFSDIYEDIGRIIEWMKYAMTGTQPDWTSKPYSKTEWLTASKNGLNKLKKDLQEIETLMEFISSDNTIVQDYDYFNGKKRVVENIIANLSAQINII